MKKLKLPYKQRRELKKLGQEHIKDKNYSNIAGEQFKSEYSNILEICPQLNELLGNLRSGSQNALLLKNWPVPNELLLSPKGVKERAKNDLTVPLELGLSGGLGVVSRKGLENTVRFAQDGSVNQETWHGHPQHNFSIFYCLQGDSNAFTYFTTLDEIAERLSQKSARLLQNEIVFEYSPKTVLFDSPRGIRLNPNLYSPSDLDRRRPNLDLPNICKGLKNINSNVSSSMSAAINEFIDILNNVDQRLCYTSGDVAIYDERTTLRYSPSYQPKNQPYHARWLRAVSVV